MILLSREILLKPLSINGTKYSKDQPWYIIIDNKVYDIKEFVPDHPGGAPILTHIGKDATDVFYSFHPESTHDLLANYYVGDITYEDIISPKGFTKKIRELKVQFTKLGYFKSSKIFYLYKSISTIILWFISVMILKSFGNSLPGVLAAAAVMALFWQQCGWISHDYLHHQVFENRCYNDWVGCFFGAVCQGFDPCWWKNKHNTHHAAPNVHGQDPDIDTHPILSWSEHALTDLFDPEFAREHANAYPQWLTRIMVNNQTINYFPILALARLSWCAQSILYILPNGQTGSIGDARMPVTLLEQICLALHYVWLVYIFSFIGSWILVFVFVISAQAICGLLLALCFSLNHNGMKVLNEEETMKTDFYVEQVITGRDVTANSLMGCWFVEWFTGGLNFQIEHHIFPTMPRHYYHKIAPIIESLCAEYNVHYHKTTFIEGTLEVFNRLGQVSHANKKMN
ncbi:delta6 fatty acid desaturase [Gigaspora rosea]|uniref:Delta6 fatty acid desaturase n=1 Tax=Gigaspora rosea TaxID=44941 RepID=A0A397V2H4_9GLOM|nr:delta6 fatty acid desaturase [Gigaspora rosea]